MRDEVLKYNTTPTVPRNIKKLREGINNWPFSSDG
jgi:hypothetical protein